MADNATPGTWAWLSQNGTAWQNENWAQVTSGLQWGHTYTWVIFTFDGVAWNLAPQAQWGSFTPQPGTATTGSDQVGLEDFYPYRGFDLGQGTALANMANGNLVIQHQDFNVPGQGLNMRLVRTHNSSTADETTPGPLGKGWRLGVLEGESSGGTLGIDLLQTVNLLFANHGATAYDQKVFVLTDIDGTRHTFVRNATNAWQSPPGVNLKLTDTSGPDYTFTRPDGVYFTFAAPLLSNKYRLDRLGDRKGNFLKFTYTADQSKLTAITDNYQRKLAFTQPADRITQVVFTDPARPADSLTTNYGYDSSARLQAVTEAAGKPEARSTGYVYGATNALIDKVTDARGASTAFTFTSGKLSALKDRAGQNWGFAGCTPALGAAAAICLTDPEGKAEVWSRNAASNLVALRDAGDVDASGNPRFNTQKYEWTNNRLTKAIDQKGNETTYGYTDLGSIKSVTRPGGDDSALTTTLAYVVAGSLGAEDMVKSTTGDRVYQFARNTDGTLNHVINPENNMTAFHYHLSLSNPVRTGLLHKVIDANLNETKYGDPATGDRGYDRSGSPKLIVDARGNPASYIYDFLGRPGQTTDREGKLWKDNYDLRGNLRSSEDPDHSFVRYCYDQNDNLKLVVPARSPQTPTCDAAGDDSTLDGTDGYSTKLTYDDRDLTSTTVAKSASTQGLTSAGIKRTEFDYYPDGQLKIVREPRSFDAGTGSVAGMPQETLYEYYPNNRLAKVFGPVLPNSERAQTTAVYDERGLPAKVTEPKSSGTQGAILTHAYNKPGQVTSTKVGNLSPTTFEYNAFGDRVRMTTPEGQGKYSTTYVPDKLGRTVSITQPPARAAGDTSAESWQQQPTTATREYDPVGNLKSITQPTGTNASTKVAYTYWENNLLKTETDPFENPVGAQHIINYEYDKEGRQKLRLDKYGSTEQRKTEWAYNNDGTVKFETSTGATLATHRSFFDYDADNNLTSVKTADSIADPVVPNISEITNYYTTQGELEKLKEAIYPPGTTTPVEKTSTFGWQRDGVINQHSIDGQSSEFDHRLDRLETNFTPFNGAGAFTATWFNNGSLNRLSMPNDAKITNEYDDVSRLDDRQVMIGSTTLSSWTGIDYDDDGNRLSEVTSQRTPDLDDSDPILRTGTATYGYDQVGRLIANHHAFDDGDTKVGYKLDNAGNVLAETAVDGPASDVQGFTPNTYSYTNNRLTARTPSTGDSFSYQYDDSGNQELERKGASGPDTTNSYDAASHPARTTTPEGKWAEYTYDGLGRQATRKTDSGETTLVFHFGLVDQSAIEEITGGAEDPRTTRYLLNAFGAPLGQQVTVHSLTPVVSNSYFVPDLRGNLSQLLGSNPGSDTGIKGIFAYDSYGKPKQELNGSGDPTDDSRTLTAAGFDSRLRYQMAPHDPLTGNYNLGPRLLNPNINRFVGADFYAAGAANLALQVDPLTGNRYMYAGANPAGLIDTGHVALPWPSSFSKGFVRAATFVATKCAVCVPVGLVLLPTARPAAGSTYLGSPPDPGEEGASAAGLPGPIATDNDLFRSATVVDPVTGMHQTMLSSELDAFSEAGKLPLKQGSDLTKAGNSIVKHGGKGNLPEAKGNASAKNQLGQDVLDDILTDPGTREIPVTSESSSFVGGTRFIAPNGNGATFGPSGNFGYFGNY